MGCGKSSVGKILSSMLSCRFEDLDSCIERMAGKSIPEIFSEKGEAAFREMEKEALKGILSASDGENIVLSLGGGTVKERCSPRLTRRTSFFHSEAGQ